MVGNLEASSGGNTRCIAGRVHVRRRINWRDDPARGRSRTHRGGCELANRTGPFAKHNGEIKLFWHHPIPAQP